MMSFYTEREIGPVALEIIGNRPGIHTSELIDAVRQQMRPDGEDCEILSDRNDDKFSQKVRNLKSHGSIAELVRTTDARDCRWYLR